jgi:hypothetical protein
VRHISGKFAQPLLTGCVAVRGQSTLLSDCLEDWIGEDNAVLVIVVLSTSSLWPSVSSTKCLIRSPANPINGASTAHTVA